MTDVSQVLIVEDEKDLNHLIAEAVRMAGYEPYQCYDGKSAFEAIYGNKCSPALVLCDVNMPKMSGLEFIKEAMLNNLNLNFCMLTANSANEDLIEALRLGVTDYIVKPVALSELVKKINRLVEIGKRQNIVDSQTKQNQDGSMAKKMENLLRLKNSTKKNF